MPVSWHISRGVVFVESDEKATFDEWKAAVTSALASGDFRHGMGLLHDLRSVALTPTAEEVRTRVSFMVTQARDGGITKWAVVVAGRVNFGMGRMAERLTDNSLDNARSVDLRAFSDMAEAEAWLRQPTA